MSYQPKYNAAFHAKVIGEIGKVGELKQTQNGKASRFVQVISHGHAIAALIFNKAAQDAEVGKSVGVCGSVVDFGLRNEGKELTPKFVVAGNKASAVGTDKAPLFWIAGCGRVLRVDDDLTETKDGIAQRSVAMQVGEFPPFKAVLFGNPAKSVTVHSLLFVQGSVLGLTVSENKKAPVLTIGAGDMAFEALRPERAVAKPESE